jgi:hypothetical protein
MHEVATHAAVEAGIAPVELPQGYGLVPATPPVSARREWWWPPNEALVAALRVPGAVVVMGLSVLILHGCRQYSPG